MSKHKLVIRKGGKEDFPSIMEMIRELAAFEKASDAVTNSVAQMEQEMHYFTVELALMDGEIVGMALYFFAYYTWVGKSLYLDDLYVKPEHRGGKIGAMLLKRVFEIAKEENCKRLRWQVLDWNQDAVRLYRRIGGNISNEWLNCDFHQKEILEYLSNDF